MKHGVLTNGCLNGDDRESNSDDNCQTHGADNFEIGDEDAYDNVADADDFNNILPHIHSVILTNDNTKWRKIQYFL